MGPDELFGKLMDITKAASVEHVFGKPEKVGEKLIIPVASVRCGFGGGWGSGKGPAEAEGSETPQGEGGGGGAGVVARPVGVLEVTADETKLIPIVDTTLVAIGGMILGAAALFLIGRLAARDRH